MSPPFWVLSFPLGFINVYWPRFYCAYLTAKRALKSITPTHGDNRKGPKSKQKISTGKSHTPYLDLQKKLPPLAVITGPKYYSPLLTNFYFSYNSIELHRRTWCVVRMHLCIDWVT